MIQIDPPVFLLASLLLLMLPLEWCFSALAAGIIHELCHMAAVLLTGGRIRWIRIGPAGTIIDADCKDPLRTLFCTLAGPVGSLLMLLLCHRFPRLALCAAVQGGFNLLPVMPLDGGRVVQCILEIFHVSHGEKLMKWLELGVYAAGILFGILWVTVLSLGFLPLLPGCLMILKGISRKRPCKQK